MKSYDEARQLVDRVCRIIPEPPRGDDDRLRRSWEQLTLDAAGQLARAVADDSLLTVLLEDEYGTPDSERPLRRMLLRAARFAIHQQRRDRFGPPMLALGAPSRDRSGGAKARRDRVGGSAERDWSHLEKLGGDTPVRTMSLRTQPAFIAQHRARSTTARPALYAYRTNADAAVRDTV